jgi:hypothetical protein
MKRWIITHDEWGIFLGVALGAGWWTKLDSVGQPSAVAFGSREEANQIMTLMRPPNDHEEYIIIEIECTGLFATIPELRAAGLAPMMGNMELDYLTLAETQGRA